MVTIGLGTGGIKANVTPMCAEQYQNSHPVLKTLKSGEQVIVDPDLTVQRLFMWFYWVVNIGALSPLITVNVEKHHSFWLAYLIPLMYGNFLQLSTPTMRALLTDSQYYPDFRQRVCLGAKEIRQSATDGLRHPRRVPYREHCDQGEKLLQCSSFSAPGARACRQVSSRKAGEVHGRICR